MANLKGSEYMSQIDDFLIRTDERGIKRYPYKRNDGMTHSYNCYNFRRQELNRFAKFYSPQKGEKLNCYFTMKHIREYLIIRLEKCKPSSKNTIISKWSSMMIGIKECNVTIDPKADNYFFQRLKSMMFDPADIKCTTTGRYLSSTCVLEMAEKLPKHVRIAMLLQYEYGFRAAEAIKIVAYSDKYFQNRVLCNVPGKSGKRYHEKKIKNKEIEVFLTEGPVHLTKSIYYRELRKVMPSRHRTHDLRLSYACNYYDEMIERGVASKEALLAVSRELNHYREYITRYYLKQR